MGNGQSRRYCGPHSGVVGVSLERTRTGRSPEQVRPNSNVVQHQEAHLGKFLAVAPCGRLSGAAENYER
ncbi:hypothetical protein HMPREF1549_02748 [Actinomyces johnsonii F0510]|uniref:Uncharacterized protein n=1 Tax=Actinomyces johnsonii F0510 TaxID=1227262 RepID=U1R8I0_9ACTO|nr:hypothetical protein HMPREF1549_02748 [Actinomyces johnsonii F0510]